MYTVYIYIGDKIYNLNFTNFYIMKILAIHIHVLYIYITNNYYSNSDYYY